MRVAVLDLSYKGLVFGKNERKILPTIVAGVQVVGGGTEAETEFGLQKHDIVEYISAIGIEAVKGVGAATEEGCFQCRIG